MAGFFGFVLMMAAEGGAAAIVLGSQGMEIQAIEPELKAATVGMRSSECGVPSPAGRARKGRMRNSERAVATVSGPGVQRTARPARDRNRGLCLGVWRFHVVVIAGPRMR